MKFAVISDLHLGQRADPPQIQRSLLSRSRSAADPRAEALIAALRAHAGGETLTLVVVGDFIDLSLAFMHEALDDLVQLVDRVEMVERIVWVAGNHDHHVWYLHSEHRQSIEPLSRGVLPAVGGMYIPTDRSPVPLALLTPLLSNVGAFSNRTTPCRVEIAYPVLEIRGVGERFYFTHGHLFGGIFTALSMLVDRKLWFGDERKTAGVNSPFIEAIWWNLGEMAEGLGADGLVESIYTDLQRGDDSQLQPVLQRAVAAIMPDGVVPGIPDSWERGAVARLLKWLIGRATENARPSQSRARHEPSADTRRGVESWIRDVAKLDPSIRTHIISGHTHVADRYDVHSTQFTSYNMGSWLVEPGHEDPDSYLLLFDDGKPGVTYQKI